MQIAKAYGYNCKHIINLIKPSMQRCPSGLRCSPGKAVCGKPHRGFESLFLRQQKIENNLIN